ncbi:MAG: ornithine cyclodeaminase family protein [Xanthomonadales bacterium]|nr:ornithine cyclodeaminase family protein [Xanthomonadales bacterium]
MSDFAVYRGEDVRRLLDFPGCVAAVRRAMAALSRDAREQPLRSITPVREGRLFALMPGMAAGEPGFGAKLISVFRDPAKGGRSAHRGIVALFEEDTGAVVCVADAHEVTRIRTACNSAVGTDALARPDAESLAIFGCGTQAEAHLQALPLVRPIRRVQVWGRDAAIAADFAARMGEATGLAVSATADPCEAAASADIICTVTGAAEPILMRDWVRPGTHINAVGSSHAGPVEIDPELVAACRYFVEYRPSALAAAAELLRARDLGLVGEDHIRAELGEVLNASAQGRERDEDITLYKSLGHIVQDLAAVRYLHARAAA